MQKVKEVACGSCRNQIRHQSDTNRHHSFPGPLPLICGRPSINIGIQPHQYRDNGLSPLPLHLPFPVLHRGVIEPFLCSRTFITALSHFCRPEAGRDGTINVCCAMRASTKRCFIQHVTIEEIWSPSNLLLSRIFCGDRLDLWRHSDLPAPESFVGVLWLFCSTCLN